MYFSSSSSPPPPPSHPGLPFLYSPPPPGLPLALPPSLPLSTGWAGPIPEYSLRLWDHCSTTGLLLSCYTDYLKCTLPVLALRLVCSFYCIFRNIFRNFTSRNTRTCLKLPNSVPTQRDENPPSHTGPGTKTRSTPNLYQSRTPVRSFVDPGQTSRDQSEPAKAVGRGWWDCCQQVSPVQCSRVEVGLSNMMAAIFTLVKLHGDGLAVPAVEPFERLLQDTVCFLIQYEETVLHH